MQDTVAFKFRKPLSPGSDQANESMPNGSANAAVLINASPVTFPVPWISGTPAPQNKWLAIQRGEHLSRNFTDITLGIMKKRYDYLSI